MLGTKNKNEEEEILQSNFFDNALVDIASNQHTAKSCRQVINQEQWLTVWQSLGGFGRTVNFGWWCGHWELWWWLRVFSALMAGGWRVERFNCFLIYSSFWRNIFHLSYWVTKSPNGTKDGTNRSNGLPKFKIDDIWLKRLFYSPSLWTFWIKRYKNLTKETIIFVFFLKKWFFVHSILPFIKLVYMELKWDKGPGLTNTIKLVLS